MYDRHQTIYTIQGYMMMKMMKRYIEFKYDTHFFGKRVSSKYTKYLTIGNLINIFLKDREK